MSKEELIKQINVVIHKTTLDNVKGAPFKIRQYADTIKLLLNYPEDKIVDLSHLTEWFKSNGKKNPTNIISKIESYVKTGYFPMAEDALKDPVVNAVVNLTKIANIGPAKAKELYNKFGIITIQDLRAKYSIQPDIIHDKQKLGLFYHEDLLQRIPRDEMEAYNTALASICSSISKDMLFSINGSFRRGLSSSGDIDVLISGPVGKNKEYRKKFIEELTSKGIIKEILASGNKKFMGIAKLNGYTYHRHIDIIDTEIEQYPFAQLYFTGSGGFNSHMRLVALKKGFSINEYCISYKTTKKPVDVQDIRKKIGKSCFETEQDIFTFIDLEFVKPEERNNATLSKMI